MILTDFSPVKLQSLGLPWPHSRQGSLSRTYPLYIFRSSIRSILTPIDSAVQPRQRASTAAVEDSSIDISDMKVSADEETTTDREASLHKKPPTRNAHTSTVVAANKRTTFGGPPPAPFLFPPGFALQSEYTAAEVLLSMECKNRSTTSMTPVHVVSTRVQRSSSWDGQAPLSKPDSGRRYTAAGCIRGGMR